MDTPARSNRRGQARYSIAVEATGLCSADPTGIAIFTREFIGELRKRGDEIALTLYYKGKGFKARKHFFAGLPTPRRYWRYLATFETGCQFNHSIDHFFLHSRRSYNIATVHDLAVLMPEYLPHQAHNERFASRLFGYNSAVAKKADLVLCISESTRRDFCKIFDPDPDKVRVIYPGFQSTDTDLPLAADDDILDRLTLRPKNYLLYVGPPNYRKNVPGLIEAYAESKVCEDFLLVIAGPADSSHENIESRIGAMGLESRIRVSSYVSPSELTSLYRNARAFAFPTFYEGFGMPILEAMSHGIPVLTGNVGGAPELAGGLAVEVDPFSRDSISAGLDALVSGSVEPDRLRRRAAEFSWANYVDHVMACYRELG